jgi:protein-disulfide isomerase
MTAPQPELPTKRGALRTALDVISTLAIVAAAGTMIWSNLSARPAAPPGRPPVPLPTEPVSIEGAPALGSPTAKVVIVEFSDFQCPYCGKFARDTLPALKAQYIDTGHVQLAFRHLPLPMHARAKAAAGAAVCAGQQGKFFEFHDSLFREGAKFEETDLGAHADQAGLARGPFDECRNSAATLGIVDADADLASKLTLASTPAFLLGVRAPDGRVNVHLILTGARPTADFAAKIDELLKG